MQISIGNSDLTFRLEMPLNGHGISIGNVLHSMANCYGQLKISCGYTHVDNGSDWGVIYDPGSEQPGSSFDCSEPGSAITVFPGSDLVIIQITK